MVALVERVTGVGVFGGLVSPIVVCSVLLTGLDMETEETVCALVEVTCI